MIRTVLGDIPGSALGHAQCHEHLLVAHSPAADRYPALQMDDAERSTQELFAYKRAGGRAILDAQPVFAGRMARGLAEASLRTGVHIVATTGFHKRMFYRDDCPLLTMNADALADLYTSEVTDGMLSESLTDRIAAKAGVIKIAFDSAAADGLPPVWTEAAIEAVRRTGAPLLVHTEKDCAVLSLLEHLLDAGISASKVILCHMDRTVSDIGIHRKAADWGAYLNYDSIHRFKYVTTEQELALITGMLERGFADRLMLSLDTTRDRFLSYGGVIGLDDILLHFLPELTSAGVDAADIHKMTVQNAANALQLY